MSYPQRSRRLNVGYSNCVIAIILFFAAETLAIENLEQTKQFYEKVVETQPANANAHFDLGTVYLAEKRYDEALVHYRNAEKLGFASSRMDSYYFNVAVCQAGLGQMEEAVSSLEKCVGINPDNKEAKDLLMLYRGKAG